jgi:hypothetical protein
MGIKPKFKPVITRVKLNPEQAVLSCDCYNTGVMQSASNLNWANVTTTQNTCKGVKQTAAARACINGVNSGFGQWLVLNITTSSS